MCGDQHGLHEERAAGAGHGHRRGLVTVSPQTQTARQRRRIRAPQMEEGRDGVQVLITHYTYTRMYTF